MPSTTLLTVLVQRLVRVFGAPAAIELVRAIPGLVVDDEGRVLKYDHAEAKAITRLLVELQEIVTNVAGAEQQMARQHGAVLPPAPLAAAPSGLRTRLLLVDNQGFVREALANFFDAQPDFVVVGQACSLAEALRMADELRPELILMEFTFPDGTGDQAIPRLRLALPDAKVVVLTTEDDDERPLAAIAAGAVGYLLKSLGTADLLNRLRSVVRGEVVLSPAIGRRIFEKLARQQSLQPAEPAVLGELSTREAEVLRLVAQGHTNRQVASALNLSVRTVEYHRANLMDKLGLRSRAELVRFAAEQGLLNSP